MSDHVHFFNHHTGRPRFHFEGNPPPTPPTPPTPPAPPTPPWHDGIEAETLGFWQNKGYDLTSPLKLATELTKQYRQAETHIGAPPDRIHRMPKADAKPEEFAAFWQGLGAPKDPKEYDFSGVKFAGNDLEPAFADAMRASLAAAFVPKDKAATIVASVVKYLESEDTTESVVNTAKLAEEKTKLATNWGTKYNYNLLQANEGARRIGITPEAVKAMENQIGYAAVMEHFRKIGANTADDTFVEGGPGGEGVTTREGATSRKKELMDDQAWAKRLLAGDVEARREYDRLNAMIGE